MDLTEDSGSTQFGRYRLLESIGQGGMADVMVAVMPGVARFNKLLVIKTIREHIQGADAQYAQMFLDEARLAARLNHQNVVHTYEVGEESGVYYIAMEYLEGQALSQVQRKLGLATLPLEARLRILIDTAHGLHHAHELTDYSGRPLHVVHCDVSPQNIFLTYDGQVKLLDFGIAKMRDADAVSVAGHVKGKIDYMAPEQLKGEVVDRTADVFALGAIMWEILAGKPMSGGRDINQVTRVHNRLAKRESAIRVVMPELDGELSRICDKALAHDKSERYPSAFEFARDLQEYLGQRSLIPTSQQLGQIIQPAFEAVRTERRKRIEAALAAVEREQAVPMQSEHAMEDHSGARLALAVRLRRNAETQSGAPTTGRAQAQAQSSAPVAIPGLRPARSSTLQKVAIVAAVVGVAAWFQLGSEPQAKSAAAPVQRTESVMQAAVPSDRVVPVEEKIVAVDEPAGTHDTVKLTVNSGTPGVQVVLDGSLIPQLPFEADVARDNAIHKIVASAPGHETITQVLTLDRDRQVALELPVAEEDATPARGRKTKRGARVMSRAVATSQAPSPASDEPRPGQEMDRQGTAVGEINDDDPYR